MRLTADELYIDKLNLERPSFIVDQKWQQVSHLIKLFIEFSRLPYIVTKQDISNIPSFYVTFIRSTIDGVIGLLNDLYEEPIGQDENQILNLKQQKIDQLISLIQKIIQVENNQSNIQNPGLIFTIVGAYRKEESINDDQIFQQLDVISQNFQEKAKDNLNKAEEIVSEISNKKQAVEEMLESYRKATGYRVFHDYAELYNIKKRDHTIIALTWLVISISLLSVFIILLLLPEGRIFEIVNKNDWSALPSILKRVLFYATIVFAFSFSLRQFSINMHIQATYAEKAINMNSFHLFMESATDKESVKDTLLQHLAKSIFEHTNSGYISENGPMMKSAFFEITKMINNQEKPS